MEKLIYNAILSKIQKEIIKSKLEIEKLNNKDMKYCKIKVEAEKLVKIIEQYKEKNIQNSNTEIFVLCNRKSIYHFKFCNDCNKK